MMFVCRKDLRIPDPVVLRVAVGVACRPGTPFANMNANAADAKISRSPNVVNFDVALLESQFEAKPEERPYYQAEVLVKSHVPPGLIKESWRFLRLAKSIVRDNVSPVGPGVSEKSMTI